MQLNVTMQLEKSTKNKHMYKSSQRSVDSLYIHKEDMPSTPPHEIKVTIEVPE